MGKPYGLIADLHNHNWNAFASINERGINSRLQVLLDEMKRAAKEVKAAGGNKLVLAGDVFHVRGSIAPTVLNPVKDTCKEIIEDGVEIIIIPGNHDLESKHSSRISSAVTALEDVGCKVADVPTFHEDLNVLVFPWVENIAKLKEELVSWAQLHDGRENKPDLVLHAPIDDVIIGLPAHGLTADWLASLGFKRVFAGHYHNHKDFGNNVYSIGALAHHTWSDPGSKAGFLTVTDDGVKWFKSHAPEFIDLTADMDKVDAEILAEGNYVRAKIRAAKNSEIEEMRAWLLKNGAKGVVIQVLREAARARATTATVKAGASVETSVAEFINSRDDMEFKDEVTRDALNVLAEAGE